MKNTILAFASCFLLCGAAQAVEPQKGRYECVGRLKFAMPADFEVANVPYRVITEQIASPGLNVGFKFSDGEAAEYANILVDAPLLISEKLSDDGIKSGIKYFLSEKERRRKARRADSPSSTTVSDVGGLPDNAYAWGSGNGVKLLLTVKNRLLLASFNGEDSLPSAVEKAKSFAKNVEARDDFSVPEKSGVCMPNSFANVNAATAMGAVSSVFKLAAHPDVTVMVSDSVPIKPDREQSDDSKSSKNIINRFWGQNSLYKDVLRIEKAFPLKNGRTVQLAGQRGLASYVKIVRKDGTVDHGYFAISQGDPANVHSSDIRMYVITHAALAKSKGVPAINSEQFLNMVDDIQNSAAFRGK